MPSSPTTPVLLRPRFGRVPTAVRYAGVGRTKLYLWAAEYPGLFKKNGSAVLVDFDRLDQILDALPRAEIRRPRALADEAAA